MIVAQIVDRDTIDMIVGTTIGGYILYVMFAAPILWVKRRFLYDTEPVHDIEHLMSTEFHDFILSKLDIDITHKQLQQFIALEHTNYRNRGRTTSTEQSQLIKFMPQDFRNMYQGFQLAKANGGSKRELARALSAQIDYVDQKSALKILRLEDKYARRFRPWWKKMLFVQ